MIQASGVAFPPLLRPQAAMAAPSSGGKAAAMAHALHSAQPSRRGRRPMLKSSTYCDRCSAAASTVATMPAAGTAEPLLSYDSRMAPNESIAYCHSQLGWKPRRRAAERSSPPPPPSSPSSCPAAGASGVSTARGEPSAAAVTLRRWPSGTTKVWEPAMVTSCASNSDCPSSSTLHDSCRATCVWAARAAAASATAGAGGGGGMGISVVPLRRLEMARSTLVLAGKTEVFELADTASSLRPSRSNSVYSTFVTPYSYTQRPAAGGGARAAAAAPSGPGSPPPPPAGAGPSTQRRRSCSTFMPSAAPTARSHDMKPNASPPAPPLENPAPASASSVVSVPAMGLEICRTSAARRPWVRVSQSNTPSSHISFQMAPWPPGFIMGPSGRLSSHLPGQAPTPKRLHQHEGGDAIDAEQRLNLRGAAQQRLQPLHLRLQRHLAPWLRQPKCRLFRRLEALGLLLPRGLQRGGQPHAAARRIALWLALLEREGRREGRERAAAGPLRGWATQGRGEGPDPLGREGRWPGLLALAPARALEA
ncbi:hypothetical protein TSOC_004535 [Tetrabaena socialis]|uniref:Uncharacterized protein n=1 Tax=Tetrabaena socialis TaxID=47790 RepID=A0A2J8A8P9_9CHLO|nr:hypothetical protein TSOC_004535 [Tetrabaena socialis]|eukprot:PNH08897.1 hypothetical protein TSOC_004535 [Tetrabaena socialis]